MFYPPLQLSTNYATGNLLEPVYKLYFQHKYILYAIIAITYNTPRTNSHIRII